MSLRLKPLDCLKDAVQFVKKMHNLKGYRTKIIQHIKDFCRIYKNVLPFADLAMAQYNALLLCTPMLSTVGSDIDKIILNRFKKQSRTFIGSTEILDSVYKPAFSIDSRYQHYFKPTLLTDEDGNLCDALHPDLL